MKKIYEFELIQGEYGTYRRFFKAGSGSGFLNSDSQDPVKNGPDTEPRFVLLFFVNIFKNFFLGCESGEVLSFHPEDLSQVCSCLQFKICSFLLPALRRDMVTRFFVIKNGTYCWMVINWYRYPMP